MSIRYYEKDHGQHLGEESGGDWFGQNIPDPDDPLQFWTRHLSENVLLNLEEFASGKEANKGGSNKLSGFTGRINLITQIAPAIKAVTLGLTAGSARGYVAVLRNWWRVFDGVEQELLMLGQPFDRIDDVRQFSFIYVSYAQRIKMPSRYFSSFITLVNAVLQDVGEKKLHCGSLPKKIIKRHLPPESETAVLRIELKQAWERTVKRWAILDAFKGGKFNPLSSEEKMMYIRYKYYASVQKNTQY